MKAFLKSSDNTVYALAPKVTTLGREGCDITLQSPGVDPQHAVIEYNEQEDGYVLQDLNTAQGTYVNECRVQNATVRLAPGDIIRLGFSGTSFQLDIENPPPLGKTSFLHQIAYPPVQQRPAWTQPLTLLTNSSPNSQSVSNQLPYLATGTTTITIPAAVWSPSQQQLPRPPLRTRPLSAGSSASSRRAPVAFERVQQYGGSFEDPQSSVRRQAVGGWVGTSDRPPAPVPVSMTVGVDYAKMQEKEQKILQLNDEVTRLRTCESEVYRKDQLINHLQQQLSEVQTRLTTQGPLVMGGDLDHTQRIVHLENELSLKRRELQALQEQMQFNELSQKSTAENPLTSSPVPPLSSDELSQKTKELMSMRTELERVKKDKGITSGLVTQMQRDMSSKDSTISRLTREIENLKKEIKDKDGQLSSLSSKLSKKQESNKSTDERDAREKELISLRQKFKSTENKMQEQQELIATLKSELEKAKITLYEEKQSNKKMEKEAEVAKSELQDMQRAERLVRVDLEQASKKLERLRSRVIQVTYSTPGMKSPSAEINDDELIGTLKSLIDERTTFFLQIKDLEVKLKNTDTASETFKKNVDDLRKHVQTIFSHLKSNGFMVSSIKQEIELLQSVSTVDTLVWVKEELITLLNSALTWEQDIEAAFDKCGINVKLSNDVPGKHITSLHAKWQSAVGDKDKLLSQITKLEEQYKTDLEQSVTLQKQDHENKISDAVEKARIEYEEKLNRALEEVRAVETEKRENEVAAEKQKMEDLEKRLIELRQNYTDLQESTKSQKDESSELLTRIEELSNLEVELREQISKLETEKSELKVEITKVSMENSAKYEEELKGHREQNKQHAVTICAMEERVVKLTKKNKEYQEEISSLKKSLQEVRAELTSLKNKPPPKPTPPPKPKVIVQKSTEDTAAMENLIVVLRKETMELKTKLQDQEDVILGLRRDLAGAHARLSDMTGELSESQKRENEKNKETLLQRERELTDVRQQLAKLSKIIDKQKDEIKNLQAELSKEKAVSVKYKSNFDDQKTRMENLESALEFEKEEQKRQLALIDHEGKITSEMTALGAQCRGERHEQVILRQREALAELRARIKTLEQTKPPLPNQEQALQQVIMLKKELAEMRATQALAEDKAALGTLDREVSRARGLLSNVNPEADMERGAHRETMDALESSENSYLTLLRAMASCLELESVEGLRPLGHIPKDERERLLMERENACQLLATRIKVLKERIARKDELLQGYERDLVKMRQSQDLAEKKANQVNDLASEMKSKTEETQYLRETLNRTRDRLNQEKRLNNAIKQKKTFHLENERAHLKTEPTIKKPHCKIEDPLGREELRKRNQKEALKKKNYEIKTLKTELSEREQSLFDTEYRLATLENSMGLGSARMEEVVES